MSSGATQSATSGTDLTITMGSYAEQVFSFADRFFVTGGHALRRQQLVR